MISRPAATRRTLLCGAALAGAAGVGLVGCGQGREEGEQASETPSAPTELGSAGEVPVGGAKLYREERLLVSRTGKDVYKAFSAVCTHRQCVLSTVEGTEAGCTCHGSRFDATTGKVLQGPAESALAAVPVSVKDGKLIADTPA